MLGSTLKIVALWLCCAALGGCLSDPEPAAINACCVTADAFCPLDTGGQAVDEGLACFCPDEFGNTFNGVTCVR